MYGPFARRASGERSWDEASPTLAHPLDNHHVTAHHYGMTSTKHRTSFALDDETAGRLRALAERWRVSQAEVVRRAVRLAAEQARSEERDIRARLAAYRADGRLTRAAADAWLDEVAESRAEWGRSR